MVTNSPNYSLHTDSVIASSIEPIGSVPSEFEIETAVKNWFRTAKGRK